VAFSTSIATPSSSFYPGLLDRVGDGADLRLSRRDLSLAFLDLGFEIRHRALLSRINPNSHKNVTKNYIPAPGNFRCTPALPQGTISPCPMPPFLPQSKRAAKT
jgi:hypothetical protein